jgi:hypothetical protein
LTCRTTLRLVVLAGAVAGLSGLASAQTPAPKNPTSNIGSSDAKLIKYMRSLERNGSGPTTRETAADNCAEAPTVDNGTHTYDTGAASNDHTGSCGASATAADVWVRYVPSASGFATFSLCGNVGDTVLEVLDGCGGATLACNDDFCGLQSQIILNVTAGSQYLVRVAGFNGGVVSGTMTISQETGGGANAADDCAAAPEVGPGTFGFDTSLATNDFTGTCGGTGGAPDVWLKYVPTVDGVATVETCGLSSNDTVLMAVDGCGGAAIRCNDDACGLQSRITFPVTTGTAVYVRVAGYNGGQAAGNVRISEQASGSGPVNDSCAGAIDVSAGGTFNYDLNGALPDYAGTCGASASAEDVFYKYTATGNEQVTITTCGQTSSDSVLEILDSCSGPTIICNDDSACGLQSTASAILSPGQTVYIRVADFNGGVHAGAIVVSSVPVVPPANDLCENATPAVEGNSYEFDTSFAGTEGSASCGFGGDPGSKDVWFRLTASRDGQLQAITCDGTSFDTIVSIYDGCNGTEIGCNDDACGVQSIATANVTAGNTYIVRVAGYGTGAGAGSIRFNVAEPCNITRPGNAADENEDCGSDINGGCNNPDFAVTQVPYGSVVWGNAWASGGTRDTDWYEFTLSETTEVTISAIANFDIRIFLLDNLCPPTIIGTDNSPLPCDPASVTATLGAGTYRAFAGLNGFDGLPCGGDNNNYILTIGTPGNTCRVDFDGDGFVDFFDFSAFVDCFEGGTCPPGKTADFDGDGFVDFFDFSAFVEAFEEGC